MYFPYDFLNSFFSAAYFSVTKQYIIHIAYKECVNPLFMSLIRLLVNSRPLVVKFGESEVVSGLTPGLF